MSQKRNNKKENRFGLTKTLGFIVGWFVLVGGLLALSYVYIPIATEEFYDSRGSAFNSSKAGFANTDNQKTNSTTTKVEKVEHIKTPESVRAIYMTTCAASTPSFRAHFKSLLNETEINSVVIDIKDFSGGIGFSVQSPELKPAEGKHCFVKDMKEYIEELHDQGVYVIGRITVFQDPFYASINPDVAVKRVNDGGNWKDRKGISYLDPGAKEVWDYHIKLSQESYNLGFDEINFDYIRFPTDGDLDNAFFPVSKDRPKPEVLEDFFAYLSEYMNNPENFNGGGVPATSADLFGMVTTNTDDLNIGQQLERALPHFDYIAPMVYPSHYPNGFNGWQNPNHYPYEIIAHSMGRAVERTVSTTTSVYFSGAERLGTSTPAVYKKPSFDKDKLRPWLQDFDYGGDYGPKEVRDQMQATYDVGLDSWMLWDPRNQYTRAALEPAE